MGFRRAPGPLGVGWRPFRPLGWGWIAFHYGRWVWIEDIGWAWVAGREWGPAWVDWRRGGGYVGWAPLPPDDVIGEIRDEPQYWVFCRPNDFLVTNIAAVFIEPE